MACQSTPTATLEGTSVISSNIVSTSVSTELRVVSGAPVVISTCVPTTVGNSSTCVPSVITSPGGSGSTSTILVTNVVTVPVVQTVRTPIQTLYAPCNGPTPGPTPDPNTVTSTTTMDSQTMTTTKVIAPSPTPSTSSSSTYRAPVTFTSIYQSTDGSGNVVFVTSAVVSTPASDQTGSSGTPNVPAIAGGVAGGVVGLIVLIGIIWYILYKQRSGRWDDIWEEDELHRAGEAEIKPARPAVDDNSSSPNPYVYGVVGRGTPSPLLRSDQASAIHSHSRSTSTATRYADHTRTNSQTPLMFATSPPHSPPTFHQNLQPPQVPGSGAGLERARTPVWASASAQQGYFHQGYPPIPSDPNFAPTATSTYSNTTTSRATSVTASSAQGLPSNYVPPTHTGANSAVAYPPGAAPPVIGGRRGTHNEYHKAPLEPPSQGATRPPSQHYQSRPSSSSASIMDAPVDYKHPLPPGAMSVHTPSIRDRKYEKGGLDVANSELPRQTSPAPSKAPSHAPIFEEAPPAYG